MALVLTASQVWPEHALAEAGEQTTSPRYYFKIVEVTGETTAENLEIAREILTRVLHEHPDFVTELPGDVAARADAAVRLKNRGLRGFEVSLRIEALTSALRPSRSVGRLKQLEVSARLGVYGGEIPSRKLAFSGTGDAMQMVEVYESRVQQEEDALLRDVLADAIRQAVEQATQKLALPAAEPLTKKRRPHAGAARKPVP